MTDLPALPKVRLICPNYAMANAWAREHGVARRRMVVISTPEQLAGTTGRVWMCWPPDHADPGYLRERVLSDPLIEVAPCTELTGCFSEAAPS